VIDGMELIINLANKKYSIDISNPLSLAIPVEFIADNHSAQQPNHFGANFAASKPMQGGSFIGDTEQGGSCNVNELTINPHCNGTHTESISHICDLSHALSKSIADINPAPLIPCVLISVDPISMNDTNEKYTPALMKGDEIITRSTLIIALAPFSNEQCRSLVIRTLPNNNKKCSQAYSSTNQPPFFTREAIFYLNERGIEHLLVDIPSLDRLHDDGLLTCHHIFWQVEEGKHQASKESLVKKTITEMAFIEDKINDGFYFINLQIPAFINDAAPSRPVLYNCTNLTTKTI